jgi:hypothetical protein
MIRIKAPIRKTTVEESQFHKSRHGECNRLGFASYRFAASGACANMVPCRSV